MNQTMMGFQNRKEVSLFMKIKTVSVIFKTDISFGLIKMETKLLLLRQLMEISDVGNMIL